MGINITDLPATFRHAVEITRRPGLRYLWIDSLCIMQDDEQDWKREAKKMGDVYANAYLALAVDSSTDDSSGCYVTFDEKKDIPFVSMDNRSLGRPTITNAALLDATTPYSTSPRLLGNGNFAIVPYPQLHYLYFSREWMPSSLSVATNQRDHPRLYKIGNFGRRFDPIENEHLSERGWTLQERLLAPRTLHFTKEQIFWECQECMLAEDGAVFPRVFPGWSTLKAFSHPHGAQPTGNSRQFDPPGPLWLEKNFRIPYRETDGWFGEVWLDLVERYTRRKLSYEKDKLPALSGLARQMASISNDVYHAGLWRRHIIPGLYWRMFVYEPHHWCDDPRHDQEIHMLTPPTRDVARVPTEYRAPSWSWASVDGKVEFQPLNDGALLANVVDCRTPAVGDDEFGQLLPGGHILLDVSICPASHLATLAELNCQAPMLEVVRGGSEDFS